MGRPALKQVEEVRDRYNLSELSRGFNLDRATVKRRIEAARIKPIDVKAQETIYELTDQLEAVLLANESDIDAERLRKLKAEADIKEMQLAISREEYVDVAEMVELVQKVISNLYQEHTVRQPKRIAAKLAKAKNVMAVKKIMKADEDRIMKELRGNFERFLT